MPKWQTYVPQRNFFSELYPAPLPEELWEKLIRRFFDPNEKKTYKDAGSMDWLGTLMVPAWRKHPAGYGRDIARI
jgi:hypothetical protein